jgi:hypothetical protein
MEKEEGGIRADRPVNEHLRSQTRSNPHARIVPLLLKLKEHL